MNSKFRTNKKRGSSTKKSVTDISRVPKKNITEFNDLKRRKEKQKSQKKGMRVFAIVMLILFVFYFGGYFLIMMNREVVASTELLSGSVELPVVLDGIIIRDEKVYKTEKAGELNFLVNDLEKVKKGSAICSISDSEQVSNVKKNLEDIEEKILALQETRENLSIVQNDAKRINGQIKDDIDDKIFVFSSNNLDNLYDLRENIDKKISLRNQLLISENRGSLENNSLINLREKTVNDIYSLENTILSTESGIVSYMVDDMEEMINFSTMVTLTKDHIKNKPKEKVFITNRKVSEKENVFKIIKSNSWYVGSYIENRLIEDWSEGDKRILYIEDGNEFVPSNVIVSKIIKDKKDSYVLFKSTKKLLDFIDKRNIKFKISESEEIGLKLPTNAITEKTVFKIPKEYIETKQNTPFVKRKGIDGKYNELLITIWLSDDENYLILEETNNLLLNDILVSTENPEQEFVLNEILNISGLFKINGEVSMFTKVSLDDSSFTEDYIILNPEKNPNLKLYDIIVSDAIGVKDGQKTYKK